MKNTLKPFGAACEAATRVMDVPPVVHLAGPGTLNCTGKMMQFVTKENLAFEFDPTPVKLLMVYGDVGFGPRSLKRLTKAGTHLSFLTDGGRRCYARLSGSGDYGSRNRLRQIRALANEDLSLRIARQIVVDKIEAILAGQRRIQRSGQAAFQGKLKTIRQSIARARVATCIDQLRGIEGYASKSWFSIMRHSLPSGWDFPSRSAHPPFGSINALLSFGYTLLHERMLARTIACGFEPDVGSLHSFKPGRSSFVCDLMEPLRLPVVDRWVLSICKQGLVSPTDFEHAEATGTKIQRRVLSRIIASYERHWNQQKIDQAMAAQILRFENIIKEVDSDGK